MSEAAELINLYRQKRAYLKGSFSALDQRLAQRAMLRCVYITDCCLITFLELGENVHRLPDYVRHEIDAYQEAQDSPSEGGQGLAEEANLQAYQRRLLADLNAQALSEALKNARAALPILLSSPTFEPIVAALESLTVSLLKLLPSSGLIPASRDIYQKFSAHREGIPTRIVSDACSVYHDLARSWCQATQLLIEIINDLDAGGQTLGELRLEHLSRIIDARLREIAESPKYRIDVPE